MTDDRHMDETGADQTRLDDPRFDDSAFDPTVPPDERSEPMGFGDLPLQPTGSGVADEQFAFQQAELGAAPPGTAGVGNTGIAPPPREGGQPAVGDEDVRDTRF